jgi:hypothetical protein
MHGDLTVEQRQTPWPVGVEQVIHRSLRLAAETCSHDDAATCVRSSGTTSGKPRICGTSARRTSIGLQHHYGLVR